MDHTIELHGCPKLSFSKPARSEMVGVIGLGLMGTAFASNLLSRGYKVHVYNRTKQKAEPLVVKGAVLHTTTKDLASKVDIALTSLTDQNAVDALAFGEDGFLGSMRKGALWIDASTIDPTGVYCSEDAGFSWRKLQGPWKNSFRSQFVRNAALT